MGKRKLINDTATRYVDSPIKTTSVSYRNEKSGFNKLKKNALYLAVTTVCLTCLSYLAAETLSEQNDRQPNTQEQHAQKAKLAKPFFLSLPSTPDKDASSSVKFMFVLGDIGKTSTALLLAFAGLCAWKEDHLEKKMHQHTSEERRTKVAENKFTQELKERYASAQNQATQTR